MRGHVKWHRHESTRVKKHLLRLPRNLHFPAPANPHSRVHKVLRLPQSLHFKVTKNTRFPLRLPRKVITKSENAHGTTTRAQSRRVPAPAHQILRACAVDMHFEDLEVNECTVSSSELARRPDEHFRSDTRPLPLP